MVNRKVWMLSVVSLVFLISAISLSAGEANAGTEKTYTPRPGLLSPALFDSSSPYEDIEGQEARRNLILLGGGISFGFFSPSDINDYMESWVEGLGVADQVGMTDMVLNIVPRLSFIYAPIEYVQFEVLGEFAWGPKWFIISGADEASKLFNFNRYTVGVNVQGHLPISNFRKSLFLGGGVEYDYITFEEYSAGNVGFRGELGFRMYFRKGALDIFLAGIYSKEMSDYNPLDSPSFIEMNYSSVMIGVNYYFKLHG